MCLAIPMRVESISQDGAVVEACGARQKVSLMFVPQVCAGDYVLVHAGFAIRQIDEGEAEKTAELLNEIAAKGRAQPA